MKIDKTCIVCGKNFIAANSGYCLCSDECRAIRRKQIGRPYNREWCKIHADKRRKESRERQRKHSKKSYCKICNAPLPHGNQKYCLDCLLKAYQNAATHSWAAGVLNSRGYDSEEVKYTIAERRKDESSKM